MDFISAPRPSNQGILVQEAGGGGADRQESRRKSSIAPLNAGQGPPDVGVGVDSFIYMP